MLDTYEIHNLLPFLLASPLFKDAEYSLLMDQLKAANKQTLSAREPLLVPGKRNDNVYLVLSGRLRVHYRISDEPIALVGQTECVGELSILDDGVASAYVIADTDCELLVIGRAEVWSLINTSHQVARNMLNIVIRRMHDANRKLTGMPDQPAPV